MKMKIWPSYLVFHFEELNLTCQRWVMKVIIWETADEKLQQVWQDEIFRVWQNLLHMQRLPVNEIDKIYRGQSMENICFRKSSNLISFTNRLRTQSRQMNLFVGKWQLWQSKYKQDEAGSEWKH